jgi:hypothetical protein
MECEKCGQHIYCPADYLDRQIHCPACSASIVARPAKLKLASAAPAQPKLPLPIPMPPPIHLARTPAPAGESSKRDFKVAGPRMAKPALGIGGASQVKRRTTLGAVCVAVLSGAVLSIYGIHTHEQNRAREQEAIRVKAEQTHLAEQEEEAKRSEMEAEQERQRVAAEQENERTRLAQEQEQKRPAELEHERLLSQLPVALSSNNFVELSFGKGELLDFDSEGIHLYIEGRPARRPWDVLTDDDAKVLLRTPKGFAAATTFGPKASSLADDDGSDLRQQMRQIWRQGSTLKERFITRMEILGICDAYNRARARFVAASANSLAYGAAAQKAKDAADQAAAQRAVGSYYALSPSARQSYVSGVSPFASPSSLLENLAANQIMSASGKPDYAKANEYSQIANAQATGAATAESALNGYVTKLSELRFHLPDSGEFPVIPPMNLRGEIAAELNANLPPPILTNAPSATTNNPP